MRLIDADALGNRMYHESFEKDSDLQRWDGGCWIRYKLFEQVLRAAPTIDPTHPTPSNTLGALDCVERRLVSYKLTDLVNEFEEILSHIREREENDSVCGLCEYDGAYMGQSGDWCNECPGFDKADCFKLKDKYKKEWLELMNTLPSVQPDVPDTNVGELISRQDAIDALKICDNNEDGINCHKCPLRDKRWDGAWQDDETNCYTKLMRDSAKLLELQSVQPETAKRIVGKSRDGMTLWYQCDMCNEPVDVQDNYCRGCGRRLIDE